MKPNLEKMEWTDLINFLTWRVMTGIISGVALKDLMIEVFNLIVRWQSHHPSGS